MWPSILLSIHSDRCHVVEKICAIVGNWNLNKGRNIYKDGNPTSALLWHVLNTVSNYQFVTEDGIIQFLYSSMISPLSMKFYFIFFFFLCFLNICRMSHTHISSGNTVEAKKNQFKTSCKGIISWKNVKKTQLNVNVCIHNTKQKKQFSNFTHNVFKNGKCYKSKLK